MEESESHLMKRKSRANPGFRDSAASEDNLSEILASRNQRLDSLSYDKIKGYKPFDHSRNRKKQAAVSSQDSVEPMLFKTRFGDVKVDGVTLNGLPLQSRTFRTVMTMTGGLFRRYIYAPIYRALTTQMAIDQAANGSAGGSASGTAGKRSP